MSQGIYIGPPGLAFRTIYDTFRIMAQKVAFSKLLAAKQPDYSKIKTPLPPANVKGLIVSSKG